MTPVFLNNTEIVQALALATASMEEFAKVPGHYTNTLRSHFVGHAGEIASEKHLKRTDIGHFPHFYDPERRALCDIELFEPHLRIEVKTWSRRFWEKLGRCVALGQLRRVRHKADVIWWVTCGDVRSFEPEYLYGLSCLRCELVGWNWTREVATAPLITSFDGQRRPIRNRQLAPADLHEFKESV